MSTQPEALALAEYLDLPHIGQQKSAAELRRQHAYIEELRTANEAFATYQDWWDERMFTLEQERDQLRAEIARLTTDLDDAKEILAYRDERSAQRWQRLWQWAHEELSEPLKTRYFCIVANGTADVMESPTYAQQFNQMKHRAESAEAEVARLSVALDDAQAAERYLWLRAEHARQDPLCAVLWKRNGDRNGSEWVETADLDAAIDAARSKT